MKILQINCVYGTGSTGRLTQAIHTHLLADGIESVVCYGRGSRSTDPHVHKICGELYAKAQHAEADLTGLVYGGCVLSTARLLHILRREAPDIVHLQCINGYFVNIFCLVRWLKRHRIPTLRRSTQSSPIPPTAVLRQTAKSGAPAAAAARSCGRRPAPCCLTERPPHGSGCGMHSPGFPTAPSFPSRPGFGAGRSRRPFWPGCTM